MIPTAEKKAAEEIAVAKPVVWIGSLTLVLLFLATLGPSLHHDVWHQMALARESLELGYVPPLDRFAYTPTVTPSVQHEWGAGFVALWLARLAGAEGLGVFNLLLAGGTVLICVLFLRRSGIGFPLSFGGAFAVVGLANYTFVTPLTAQSYSVLMTALLLYALRQDRAGGRLWIAWWLPLFVLWANLHGGIVVGFAILLAHVVEQAWRKRPWLHIALLLPAMLLLIGLNPYGRSYYSFLLHAYGMPRPFIPEWDPFWLLPPASPRAVLFLAAVALFGYAVRRRGVRNVIGFLMVLGLVIGAAKTMKLVPFFALAWLFVVPGALRETPLGGWVESLFRRRQTAVVLVCVAAIPWCLGTLWREHPWSPVIAGEPSSSWRGRGFCYPVGPVEYLKSIGFKGNAMTFFRHGPYVSWKLHPDVKVSCDSRYEVAFPPALVDDNFRFYLHDVARVFDKVLGGYPTDIVIVDRRFPLAKKMAAQAAWKRVYSDDGFEVYARPGLPLPVVSRTGTRITGSIP
ncbi:MAG TPA: hypothetical protein VN442_24300 [Bryobacteraceae bacterium]|nr:hypothetical protein [Bryobacteraceae bacterium]